MGFHVLVKEIMHGKLRVAVSVKFFKLFESKDYERGNLSDKERGFWVLVKFPLEIRNEVYEIEKYPGIFQLVISFRAMRSTYYSPVQPSLLLPTAEKKTPHKCRKVNWLNGTGFRIRYMQSIFFFIRYHPAVVRANVFSFITITLKKWRKECDSFERKIPINLACFS